MSAHVGTTVAAHVGTTVTAHVGVATLALAVTTDIGFLALTDVARARQPPWSSTSLAARPRAEWSPAAECTCAKRARAKLSRARGEVHLSCRRF